MHNRLYEHLTQLNQTLSVAESCTGGGLAYELTAYPSISKIFLGGVVTYANKSKEKLLHIPKKLIDEHGAVSEPVALLMAKNCRSLFQSTWALSTTGISGPTSDDSGMPVGIVWIGCAGPSIAAAVQYDFPNLKREEHRKETIKHALLLLASFFSIAPGK